MNRERIEQFLQHLKVDFEDDALIVLKGHLLIELALRDFIGKRVKCPERIEGVQIAFPSLVAFASSLEDSAKHQWLWTALKKANLLRNQLAHQLSPAKLDEMKSDFVSYVTANDGEFAIEINNVELNYNSLALAFLQVFDVLIHLGPALGGDVKPNEIKNALLKAFDIVAKANA